MVTKLLQKVLALPSNNTVRLPTNSKYGSAEKRTNTRRLFACFMTAPHDYDTNLFCKAWYWPALGHHYKSGNL
jgi:hypothetical protein